MAKTAAELAQELTILERELERFGQIPAMFTVNGHTVDVEPVRRYLAARRKEVLQELASGSRGGGVRQGPDLEI